MNHVSDLRLVRAAAQAGITPGIFLDSISKFELENYLQDYHETNLMLALPIRYLLKNLDYYVNMGVKYFDIPAHPELRLSDLDAVVGVIDKLQSRGIKIMSRSASNPHKLPFDAYMVKGSEGAGGAWSNTQTLQQIFDSLTDQPAHIIPTGGIYCAEQIKYYLDRKASAVAIGTLFALSEESKLSHQTKIELIQKTSADLARLGQYGKQGIVYTLVDGDDDRNHNIGLQRGIQDLRAGHVYCGTAIDHVNSIRPIQDIVNDLTGLL